MKSFMEHPWSLWSVVLGLFVLWTYALKRFNEPTFQEKKALPNTVYPVQYLFLPPDYARARSAYLIILTSVYLVFVLAGPDVIPPDWAKVFPPESFALGLAAVFAGLLPNSDSQFLKIISSLEVELRRRVHAAFFVPSRIEETIVVLDTAPYDPPPGLLEFIAPPLRDELKRDLRNRKLRSTSLEYRWARARMLMEALGQIGRNRETLPLEAKDFAPFAKDLETLREKYKKLDRDMATIDRRPSADSDELASSVDDLLYGIYAYIAWGVRRQAKKEMRVYELLEALGFRVTHIEGRSFFDIVIPPVLVVSLIVAMYWVTVDWTRGHLSDQQTVSDSIVGSLFSGIAAGVMYGLVIGIALNRRAGQIKRKVWDQGSLRSFVPVIGYAALATCAVVIITTLIQEGGDTVQSLSALVRFNKSSMLDGSPSVLALSFLPIKAATAVPWLIAGAVVAVLLALLVGGDVRRTSIVHRVRDSLIVAAGLGLAAGLAQVIQAALALELHAKSPPPLAFVPIGLVALVGCACGAIIGFMVPHAFRANVVRPSDLKTAQALENLVRIATSALHGEEAGKNWVFTGHSQLCGITPAEALQYEGMRNEASRLLRERAPHPGQEELEVAPVPVQDVSPDEAPSVSPATQPAETEAVDADEG